MKPLVDMFAALDEMGVFKRPAMFFGSKNLSMFFGFYHGMVQLSKCPAVITVENDLYESGGFVDWACAKHGWARNVVTEYHYILAATAIRGMQASTPVIEETAFDLFLADLEEYRAL